MVNCVSGECQQSLLPTSADLSPLRRDPPSAAASQQLLPQQGILTWLAEGSSDPRSRYYSRVAHVPGPSSGVTIGRGYDLKLRSETEIVRDLISAGLSERNAQRFAAARGLYGARAAEFLVRNSLPEITPTQELNLFSAAWESMRKDVARICSSPAVVEKYGAVDFETLPPVMQEVLTDLRFRGDYTPRTRAFLQDAVVSRDLARFEELLADRSRWEGVPRQRYLSRCSYLLSCRAVTN